MNKSVWLSRLLGLGGIVEIAAGLGLLIDPAGGAKALFGAALDAPGMGIGRIGGGGLLALGIACWVARKTPDAPASIGVAWAYLTYTVVTCVTLTWASASFGGGSLTPLGAAVLHGAFGVVFLCALVSRKRTSLESVPRSND